MSAEVERLHERMIARCVKRWPDFTIGVELDAKHGHVMRAWCTHAGKPMTLALIVDDPDNAHAMLLAKTSVLNGCISTIETLDSIS